MNVTAKLCRPLHVWHPNVDRGYCCRVMVHAGQHVVALASHFYLFISFLMVPRHLRQVVRVLVGLLHDADFLNTAISVYNSQSECADRKMTFHRFFSLYSSCLFFFFGRRDVVFASASLWATAM